MPISFPVSRPGSRALPPQATLGANQLIETADAKVLTAAERTKLANLAKADVGLGNVDNTSDASKPISTAAATALAAKAPLASPAFTGTPTGITKTHVGLGNVDNTSDANKPISTAQAAVNSAATTALAAKAPLVGGLVPLGNLPAGTPNNLATLGADGILAVEQRPIYETTRYYDCGGTVPTSRPVDYADHIIFFNSPTKPGIGISGDSFLELAAEAPQRPTANVLWRFDTYDLTFTTGIPAPTLSNKVVGGPSLVPSGGPLLVTESGHNFLRFDGVDDKMTAPIPAGNMPVTIMFAGRYRTNAASKPFLSASNTGARASMAQSAGTTAKFNMFHDINFPSTVSVDTNWHFFCLTFNGTNSGFVVDAILTTGSVGSTTPAVEGFQLGCGTDGTIFGDIEVADPIAYSAVVDTAGVQNARAWYKSKHPVLV